MRSQVVEVAQARRKQRSTCWQQRLREGVLQVGGEVGTRDGLRELPTFGVQ